MSNNGASTVSVIATSNNTNAATVNVAAGPRVVTISPDGTTAFVASTGIDTVTPITISNNTTGVAIASPGGPYGGAIVPDQHHPVLEAVATGQAMTPITFDASASSDTTGTIASYAWNFGDGTSVVTTAIPTTSHPYAFNGTYTVSVTLTDAVGATSTVVFTGQTVSRNGKCRR